MTRMYSFVHKLLVLIGDVEYILSPVYKRAHRKQLLFEYIRLRVKASLNRWFHFTHEHFLSFNMIFPDYEIFFVEFRQIFVRNVYYTSCVKTAPAIIDCGGNIGMSVLYWKYLYPQAHIHVFEPSHEVIGSLEENIRRNNLTNITVIRAATSSHEGTARMHQRGSAACGNTLERSVVEATPHKHPIESYEVPTVRLSAFIDSNVDILKLDIEGSEGSVLKELVKANKFDQIRECVLEYHYYPTSSDNQLADILALFNAVGFESQLYFEEYDSTTSLSLTHNGSYAISIRAIRTENIAEHS